MTASVVMHPNQNTRIKEGIININPDEEPLRSELLSGKFTVLVSAEGIGNHPAGRTENDARTGHVYVGSACVSQPLCLFINGNVVKIVCMSPAARP